MEIDSNKKLTTSKLSKRANGLRKQTITTKKENKAKYDQEANSKCRLVINFLLDFPSESHKVNH